MLISVRERNLQKVLDIFQSEEVEATPIGFFTADKMLRTTYNDVLIVNMDLNFLYKELKVTRTASWTPPLFQEPFFNTQNSLRLSSVRRTPKNAHLSL